MIIVITTIPSNMFHCFVPLSSLVSQSDCPSPRHGLLFNSATDFFGSGDLEMEDRHFFYLLPPPERMAGGRIFAILLRNHRIYW